MDLGPIHLEHTLSCGQAFRWWRRGDAWEGVVQGRTVRLWQEGRGVEVESDLPAKVLEAYFRADDDYDAILREISKEAYVARLVRRFPGLRLLRQDPWECSASYILATFSNIPRIRGMVERLCSAYGREIGPGVHAFPRPQEIIRDARAAQGCGLGFRCSRFLAYTGRVARGEVDFALLRGAGYQEAHRRLVRLEGIGDKVADCVAVFSLDHLEAFPVDVRIGRALEQRYGIRGSYGQVSRLARERFGPYAGYAQEFMYYAEDRRNRPDAVTPAGS